MFAIAIMLVAIIGFSLQGIAKYHYDNNVDKYDAIRQAKIDALLANRIN